MSVRYSSSPTLHLKIGRSRLRAQLYGALCTVTACTLWSICARGYALLALLLTPVAAGLVWRLRHDAKEGAELCYRQGCWFLQQGAQQRQITLTQRSTVTPWLIYLVFNELSSGPTGRIWLYADSSSAEQLRRLRVRLVLQQ